MTDPDLRHEEVIPAGDSPTISATPEGGLEALKFRNSRRLLLLDKGLLAGLLAIVVFVLNQGMETYKAQLQAALEARKASLPEGDGEGSSGRTGAARTAQDLCGYRKVDSEAQAIEFT